MKFYIVDCFAEEKYQGNQLLVIKADRPLSDEEQQTITREIGFSETSFIFSDKKEDNGYDVRIWTPGCEVPFAGHPTLGTAHVIREVIENDASDTVLLNLKVGQIPVIRSEYGQMMLQNPPVFGNTVEKEEICEVFGIEPGSISDKYPIQWASAGLEAVIVPLVDRAALSNLKMDRDAFNRYVGRHPENYCNHLFFVETADHTFAARCLMEDFNEDPATGSANGNLAGYLMKHNYFGTNSASYKVIQGEDMGRKSVLHVNTSHIDEKWDIRVGGECYIVASGDWS